MQAIFCFKQCGCQNFNPLHPCTNYGSPYLHLEEQELLEPKNHVNTMRTQSRKISRCSLPFSHMAFPSSFVMLRFKECFWGSRQIPPRTSQNCMTLARFSQETLSLCNRWQNCQPIAHVMNQAIAQEAKSKRGIRIRSNEEV